LFIAILYHSSAFLSIDWFDNFSCRTNSCAFGKPHGYTFSKAFGRLFCKSKEAVPKTEVLEQPQMKMNI
jgi:hypothetical protein